MRIKELEMKSAALTREREWPNLNFRGFLSGIADLISQLHRPFRVADWLRNHTGGHVFVSVFSRVPLLFRLIGEAEEQSLRRLR